MILAIILTANTLTLTTATMKMTFKLQKYQKECLYDKLKADEHATASVIVLTGDVLKAKGTISGPFAAESLSAGPEVYNLANLFNKARHNPNDKKKKLIQEEFEVSYEDIYEGDDDDDDDEVFHDDDFGFDDDMDDVMIREYYYELDDDDFDDDTQFYIDDAMPPEEVAKIEQQKAEHSKMTSEQKEIKRKERKEDMKKEMESMLEQRKKTRESRQKKKEEERKKKNQRKMTDKEKSLEKMKQGEMFQKTIKAESPGWYMFCVDAAFNEISAEFEFRKAGDVGEINTKTGHLQTYERYETMQKEKRLFQKMRDEENELKSQIGPKEEGVEEKDLELTRKQIQKINRLLDEVRKQQEEERHRVSIHKSVNEHSHSKMVLSSLTETVIYILVSGFQVYTIRKWFSGSPILGY